jgi:hypothetical protein
MYVSSIYMQESSHYVFQGKYPGIVTETWPCRLLSRILVEQIIWLNAPRWCKGRTSVQSWGRQKAALVAADFRGGEVMGAANQGDGEFLHSEDGH